MIESRVKIKHFSIVGLMSPGRVRIQVRTHSDFCWTRGLGLWPTGLGLGLGLWSNGLGLGLRLWSNRLGLTPDGLGLWPDGLGLGLGLWPCGLGLTTGLASPDSLQHCLFFTHNTLKSKKKKKKKKMEIYLLNDTARSPILEISTTTSVSPSVKVYAGWENEIVTGDWEKEVFTSKWVVG